MMRVKNEARWIHRSLLRSFLVAKSIVVFDDGSTDETESVCLLLVATKAMLVVYTKSGWIAKSDEHCLHFLRSPFQCVDANADTRRLSERVHEVRDRDLLWSYTKLMFPEMQTVLSVDGDEALSLGAVRHWSDVLFQVAIFGAVSLPVVYLWGDEQHRRVDGVYASLSVPRVGSVQAIGSEKDLFNSSFRDVGNGGGFHCGSLPSVLMKMGRQRTVAEPVLHFGYIDTALRQSKYEFYNRIDPGNLVEGEYRHIIGLPSCHTPGPVVLVPFEDV